MDSNFDQILNLSARFLAPASQKMAVSLHLGSKFIKSELKCKTRCKGVKEGAKNAHLESNEVLVW